MSSGRSKPIINLDFICSNVPVRNQADIENMKLPSGEFIRDMEFTSIDVMENLTKGCVAFLMHKIPPQKYQKISRLLLQQHGSLPKNHPDKLTPMQVAQEVQMRHAIEMAEIAIKRGAKLLVSNVPIDFFPCLWVTKLKEALFKLVGLYARMFDAKTVQVTGSTGKTSTWEFIDSMLTSCGKSVHRNRLNNNDYPGVVGTIAKLETHHEFVLQETQETPSPYVASLGSLMLAPKVGIITNAGASHLENMKTKANVVQSCLGIMDGMGKDSLLVYNSDDKALSKKLRKPKLPTVSYGMKNRSADYFADNIAQTQTDISFDLVHKNGRVPIKIPTIGEHNVYNALAAYITGKHLGLAENEILDGIANYSPRGIRQNISIVRGRTLYIDCKSATVESTIAAAKAISEMEIDFPGGRRVAVFGWIRQLGSYAEEGHKKVGRAIADLDLDVLICYGLLSQTIAETIAGTNDKIEIHIARNYAHLIELIRNVTKQGDIVLFKSSQSAKLEVAVDMAFGTYFALEDKGIRFDMVTVDFLSYKLGLNHTHATIVDYVGEDTNVTVPGVLQEQMRLFGISDRAFFGKESIESVTLPDLLVNIGSEAFADCPNLTRIYVPPSVFNIGEDAFKYSPVTIYGEKDSYAEEYAAENGIGFEEHGRSTARSFNFVPVKIDDAAHNMHLAVLSNGAELPSNIEVSAAELLLPVAKPKTLYAQKLVLQAANEMLIKAAEFGSDELVFDLVCDGGCMEHKSGLIMQYTRSP